MNHLVLLHGEIQSSIVVFVEHIFRNELLDIGNFSYAVARWLWASDGELTFIDALLKMLSHTVSVIDVIAAA